MLQNLERYELGTVRVIAPEINTATPENAAPRVIVDENPKPAQPEPNRSRASPGYQLSAVSQSN